MAPEIKITEALLDWYDRHARVLPWRIGPKDRAKGIRPDPYRVWLSEIMLQQTTVRAVESYFKKFVNTWPTIHDLAGADQNDILKAWAGLGYYSRARNLHTCARRIVAEHAGEFPSSAKALKALPGIGDYTAAAISAIAFDRAEAVVDGNVERVMARIQEIDVPNPALKKQVRKDLQFIVPGARPGDFAQAMMDLGATLCTPRNPACGLCPCRRACRSAGADPERFPVKAPKTPKPTRLGALFVLIDNQGRILLRQRPEKGLLGGMTEIPGSPWAEDFSPDGWPKFAPVSTQWTKASDEVRHTFTHFHLIADVYWGRSPDDFEPGEDAWWTPLDKLADEALPTVMRKAVQCGLAGVKRGRKRL